jgi:hypothetical protein
MIATRRACAALLFACGVSFGVSWATPAAAQLARLTDRDIIEAYEYMLGRWLVLRQETLDLKEGFKWNEIIHREPGGVAWANPNLDVVYSEAWIAVDETSCTLIDLPEIKGRYYTVQVLNGWGEVTANINERNYPKHPFGKFALCLKGNKMPLPKGTQRVELPSRKSRILMRVELGANRAEAIALQKKVTMKATGSPKVEKAVVEFTFTNDKLPGVEAFEKTKEILASEPDINQGMVGVQEKVSAVVKAAADDPKERARIDDVIRKRAIPAFHAEIPKMGKAVHGWVHPRATGNYRSDYVMRAVANYAGIWANNSKEAVYFTAQGVDGSQTYTQTFPADALPASKAKYFWSVIAVDGAEFRVIPNPANRFLLNKQSPLKFNDDGSLTLAFGPRQPQGIPEANWLPTPQGKRYNLTFRLYGPAKEATGGTYYPPPLVRK